MLDEFWRQHNRLPYSVASWTSFTRSEKAKVCGASLNISWFWMAGSSSTWQSSIESAGNHSLLVPAASQDKYVHVTSSTKSNINFNMISSKHVSSVNPGFIRESSALLCQSLTHTAPHPILMTDTEIERNHSSIYGQEQSKRDGGPITLYHPHHTTLTWTTYDRY